jgi:uncharacterized protein YodC (DUF2158 family)
VAEQARCRWFSSAGMKRSRRASASGMSTL